MNSNDVSVQSGLTRARNGCLRAKTAKFLIFKNSKIAGGGGMQIFQKKNKKKMCKFFINFFRNFGRPPLVFFRFSSKIRGISENFYLSKSRFGTNESYLVRR